MAACAATCRAMLHFLSIIYYISGHRMIQGGFMIYLADALTSANQLNTIMGWAYQFQININIYQMIRKESLRDSDTRFSSVLDEEEQFDGNLTNFQQILKNNKEWARKCLEAEKDYFTKLVKVQTPKYLWIGCADSRVPANEIMGLKPGEVFVHRNVANIAPPSDINVLAVVQYAVEYLKVEDIIVSGHYGCGGIKAAFQSNDFGPLQSWLSHIRELRCKYRESLIGTQSQKERTLVELNVRQQVINISRIPAVQKAWLETGRVLSIHGTVYNLENGILKDLGLHMQKLEDVPKEYRLTKSKQSK